MVDDNNRETAHKKYNTFKITSQKIRKSQNTYYSKYEGKNGWKENVSHPKPIFNKGRFFILHFFFFHAIRVYVLYRTQLSVEKNVIYENTIFFFWARIKKKNRKNKRKTRTEKQRGMKKVSLILPSIAWRTCKIFAQA